MTTFPKFSQWKQIFKVLKKGEKITLLVFLALGLASVIFLAGSFYINNTKVVPAFGGTYVEGVVGQPRFVNPVYGETNDVDRTLIDLVYSGLLTYDSQGKLTKDLVDNYTVSGDGKTYTFTLKNNLQWHDGKPLNADDVIFTIATIQNSDYKSPLRANWIDVQVVKISDKSFSFILKQPYNSFLENCTVKIIPKHIWESISPENFILSLYNLQPVGSGPFEFKDLKQNSTGFVETFNLQSNRRYYGSPSHISDLSFKFFEKFDDVVSAAKLQTINGFALGSSDKSVSDIESQIRQGWSSQQKLSLYSFSLPRYFAVFLNNQKSSIFADPNLRKALAYLVDKNDLVEKTKQATGANILAVDSPVLPDFYGYQQPANPYAFDAGQAKTLLDKTGFKDDGTGVRSKTTTKKPAFSFNSYLKVGSKGTQVTQLQSCLTGLGDPFKTLLATQTSGTYDGTTEAAVTEFQEKYLPDAKPTGETGAGTRQKLNELCASPTQNSQPLAFTLTTINQPQLMAVANLLKEYWAAGGVSVTINAVSITDLKPIIKNRTYDALLYGETLGSEPDLYPFWYSSQKQDPGLNLSQYENKDVDKLLKDARTVQDEGKKEQDLQQLQDTIISDAPALFLYNPDYVYFVSDKVKGIDTQKIVDPSKRIINITNWYIATKRVWK